jgi:hypothetical protein
MCYTARDCPGLACLIAYIPIKWGREEEVAGEGYNTV